MTEPKTMKVRVLVATWGENYAVRGHRDMDVAEFKEIIQELHGAPDSFAVIEADVPVPTTPTVRGEVVE